MRLAAGIRLGPYEILAAIGAGGMGEVYRARDPRLDREVALKVLPDDAMADPDRARRFEQEARAVAALNHPNILAVHDVGVQDGVHYVVSELLEGVTLGERLAQGPLPARKALGLAAQVARGLAAAHDKGVVHRDVKPDNLFLTRDGRVKILDFGLARIVPPGEGLAGSTITIDQRLTAAGTVLGTMGYMSPEQVRGTAGDSRSDIFSFGAVLYEMLSGRRAFRGETAADTMSAILTVDPPDLGGADPALPPMADRLVRRCLEKDPDERFQSARDLAFDLEALASLSGSTPSASGEAAVAVAPRRARRRWALAAFAAGLLLGTTAVWFAASWRREAVPLPSFQQVTFRRGTVSGVRFAPDGQTIVYSARWEGRPDEIFTARAGSPGELPLGIQGQLLAVSSTGELAVLVGPERVSGWVYKGTLARAPLAGGAPREMLRDVIDADWSPDGQRLAVIRLLEGSRFRLEYPLGTTLYETDAWIERPRVSRDGSRVLFVRHGPLASGTNAGRLAVVTAQGEQTDISPEFTVIRSAVWSPSGDEVWFAASTAAGSLLQPLALRPGGQLRPLTHTPIPVGLEDASADGRVLLQTMPTRTSLVVKTPTDTSERDISWFDYPLLRDISPDGRTVLFDEQGFGSGSDASVFVRPTDGGPATRLAVGHYGGWFSPDMLSVLAFPTRTATSDLAIVPVGPGDPRTVTLPFRGVRQVRWFPDGQRLAFIAIDEANEARTYEYVLASGATRPLTPPGFEGTAISPDGSRLLARAANTYYVVAIDGDAPREIQGPTAVDTILRWSPDGRALFVSKALSRHTRDVARFDLATGARQTLFTVGPADGSGVFSIGPPAVSADGRTYAYNYLQWLSHVFIVEGLR
jgi:Tol biopolymer transport system component